MTSDTKTKIGGQDAKDLKKQGKAILPTTPKPEQCCSSEPGTNRSEEKCSLGGFPLGISGFCLEYAFDRWEADGSRSLAYELPSYTKVRDNEEVRQWFLCGMVRLMDYNHTHAIECFRRATEVDPTCAMAHWGVALACGAHYNNPSYVIGHEETAYIYSRKALELCGKYPHTCLEIDLINSLFVRYECALEGEIMEEDYVSALAEIHEKYGDGDTGDIAMLYVEAMMNLRAWELWDRGLPAPGTSLIHYVLSHALERHPNHIGLCHLYIHLMEMGPVRELAVPVANRLRKNAPCDAGHLLHMPSHIDVLIGNYQLAIETNQRAILADKRLIETLDFDPIEMPFEFIYQLHNLHFLVYASMFAAKKELALKTADLLMSRLCQGLNSETADDIEWFGGIRWHVLIRFGMWQEIIDAELPKPRDQSLMAVTTTSGYYAKGIAYAATNRTKESEFHLAKFQKLLQILPERRAMSNNTAKDVLKIGHFMLRGELEYRKGEIKKALVLLRIAVDLDDSLEFDEPWAWAVPVRHALAAFLLEQGDVEESEKVYRRDLEKHPRNLWSLEGLRECYEKRNRPFPGEFQTQLEHARAIADFHTKVSCLCRIGKPEPALEQKCCGGNSVEEDGDQTTKQRSGKGSCSKRKSAKPKKKSRKAKKRC